jgi:hypothetical protein
MSPTREAVTLPVLFLTVLLVAGARPGAPVFFTSPSLGSLVTAMVLLALLVRSGALAPERLMNPVRSMMANLNGLSVLLTMYAASAQVITMVVPESGLPALLVWVVLWSLVLQAFALGPDRTRMLRGMLVTFGATFVLKFLVLASLSTPAETPLARALQLLFEGVTLGTVAQRPVHAAEGYLALAALVLYFIGVALLPSASWQMVRVARKELTD